MMHMWLLKEVEDPTRFDVASFDKQGRLVRLVKKPKVPPNKYVLIGVYFFKPIVFGIMGGLGLVEPNDAKSQ